MPEEKKTVQKKNLYQKLQSVHKLVDVIQKNKDGYGYKYVTEDEILSKLTVALEQENIQVYPEIVPGTAKVIEQSWTKNKLLKNGTQVNESVHENVVLADMKFTWVDIDNPNDKIVVPWIVVGQQSDASQALGSGLTYCTRYFYLKFFHIATTDDDPDNWRSKQSESEAKLAEETAEIINKEINVGVQKWIANFKDETEKKKKTDGLLESIKLNNGGSLNYMKIKDPVQSKELKKKLWEHMGITEGEIEE